MQEAAGLSSIAGENACLPPPHRRMSAFSKAWLAAVSAAAVVPGAFAQAPPILNSPYICPNGITYTVTTCKPYRADQWCETTEQQNGRLVTTMDSSWSAMKGRLQGCTNAGNSKPAPAAPAQSASAAQQTFNPPYLKEFPAVDQITTQLKGSSPQDTAYRQLTALHEFAQMIAALAGSRMNQNQLTPDELRILTSYFNAYNSIAKSTVNPQDAYANRPDFTASLFTTFPMPTIQQLWLASTGRSAGQQAGVTSQPSQLPPANDPATAKARRCVELGGTMAQCTIGGLGEGLFSMLGVNPDALTGAGSGPAGLVLFGSYKASGGLLFSFADGGVNIGGCGAMVQGSHSYSIQPSGSQYAIKIVNQPQALAMVLGAGGKISGPAAQDISGQKIVGYYVQTNLKTGASTRTPDYGPVTVHCTVGTLQPGPPEAPTPDLATAAVGAISATTALLSGNPQNSMPGMVAIAPGPRFVGTYVSTGGLKIAFSDGGAILDCAQAHVKTDYDVVNAAGVIRIAVKNGSSPFTLTLGSNGSLTGSGATTVNGKLMTGLNGDTPVLSPTSASCPVDMLAPAK